MNTKSSQTAVKHRSTKSVGWMLAAFIIICEAIGITSGLLASAKNNEWFDQLVKPAWNPPSYVFAPVWTTLYLLMGIAWWLVWKSNSNKDKGFANGIFIVQLILNFFWSILFFKLHNAGAAFAEIVLLWVCIVLCMLAFGRHSRLAMWLLLPYLLWVSFASYLNFSIWQLNS
jgi:tryptophan-rich sensory protein